MSPDKPASKAKKELDGSCKGNSAQASSQETIEKQAGPQTEIKEATQDVSL
jgi:hypothetical protein